MNLTHQLPNNAFTHSGKFHADDVFSTALLTYLNPDIIIERGYEVPENYNGIVFDIGLGEFDHHQEGSQVRENGIPYAAFGLLWKQYGTEILEAEEAIKFEESFVQPLDLSDNTGSRNEIAEIVSLFNPTWDSKKDPDLCFQEAKSFALTLLEKKFERIKSVRRASAIVSDALEHANNQIAVLSIGAPWKQFIIGTDIDFVAYPSDRGGFGAQGVPIERDTMELKIPFPEAWRGKRDNELKEISGIKTLRFCHNSGFLIATDTLDDALSACNLAREKFNNNSITNMNE